MAKLVDMYVFDENGKVTMHSGVAKPDLKTLQAAVGGLIEAVYTDRLTTKRGIDVWANEEGLLLNMKRNFIASHVFGVDLVGPVVLVDNRSDRSVSPFKVKFAFDVATMGGQPASK